MRALGYCTALAIAASGCGSGAFSTHSQVPVATLQLRIASALEAPGPDTRAAIVWRRAGGTETSFVAQDLGPASNPGVVFALAVLAAPPDDTLVACGPDCTHASGNFVLYNDDNHNQAFDLVSVGDTVSHDRVLGSLKDDADGGFNGLSFVSGSPDASIGITQPAGLSWLRISTAGEALVYPIDTVVDVALDGINREQSILCSGGPGVAPSLKPCGCHHLDAAEAGSESSCDNPSRTSRVGKASSSPRSDTREP